LKTESYLSEVDFRFSEVKEAQPQQMQQNTEVKKTKSKQNNQRVMFIEDMKLEDTLNNLDKFERGNPINEKTEI